MSSETPKPALSFDDDAWRDLFENAFFEDITLADKAAKLWYYLLSEIQSGEEGIIRTRDWLEHAIRLTFLYTSAFREARDRFEAALNEPSDNEPPE